jgi:hypothetical protein
MTSLTLGRRTIVWKMLATYAAFGNYHPHMFELRSVGALFVNKRRIRFNNTARNQVIQTKQVFFLAQTIQISSAKWQGSKIPVYNIEKLAGRCDSQCNIWCILSLCVMGCFILSNVSPSFANKSSDLTSSVTYPFPVLPKVSIANTSPSSIFV